MDELQKGEILIYQSESGDTKIDVYHEDGTVWLSQALISELYQTTPQNIIMHTRKIYLDGELDESATCKQSLQVQIEGNRTVRRSVKTPMYMKDWVESLNEFLTFRRRNILHGSGKVSNADMERRVLAEYAKFNTRRLKSPPDLSEEDVSVVDELSNTVNRGK